MCSKRLTGPGAAPPAPRGRSSGVPVTVPPVAEEPITIEFTHDQALVLSDWLYQAMHQSDVLDDLLKTDRAVWSPIYAISGALETTFAEIFMPNYDERLKAARQRLLVEMYGSDDEAETGETAS